MEFKSLEDVDTHIRSIRIKFETLKKGLHFHVNESAKELMQEIDDQLYESISAINDFSRELYKQQTVLDNLITRLRRNGK
jgi:hypothetical protein